MWVSGEPLGSHSGRGLRGLDDSRVVLEDVLRHLAREQLDDVATQHGLHVHVGARGKLVDAVTRNRVADQCRGRSLVFEAEPDGRADRRVHRRCGRDVHVADAKRIAGLAAR